MAEGLLDGLLGGEEEAADVQSTSAFVAGQIAASTEAEAAGTEAIAAGIALNPAVYGPKVEAAAREFLTRQTTLVEDERAVRQQQVIVAERHAGVLETQNRLLHEQTHQVKVQTHHLEAEHHLRMGMLRLRMVMQLFGALAVTVVGAVFAFMVYDAATSRSVVVDAFEVPVSLASRGVTGKSVASAILDDLQKLQAATRSTTAGGLATTGAWSRDIKIELPETGVSIGEISRVLHAYLGHDLHVDGELVETEGAGLVLTVRGDRVPAKSFKSDAGDLEQLGTKAAEYVYGESQPARYATYLDQSNRNAEVIAFAKAAYPTAAPAEQPLILNIWANAIINTGGDSQEAMELYREAIKLKPDYWAAYDNIMNMDLILGNEEGVWRDGDVLLEKAGGRPGRAPEVDYSNVDLITWNLLPWRNAMIADAKAHAGFGSSSLPEAGSIADVDIRLHDDVAAELQLRTAPDKASDPRIPAMAHFVRGRLAGELGDVKTAASEMEAFQAAYADPIVSSQIAGYDCWVAPAEEAASRPGKADAALKAGGHYVDCLRFRGDILDGRGDWPAAEKVYAEAVAMAPDLPAGDYSWGVALARHGLLAEAIEHLSRAHEHGPHWADPLKAWGDMLVRQGKAEEALARYDEALKWAPAWKELNVARDAIAGKK